MSRPVIKAPECPEELAPSSVVLDREGYVWQRFSEDRWFGQPGRVAASFRWPQLLADRGDLTVLHDAGAEDLDESTLSQQAHVTQLIDTVTAYRLAVHKHLGLGARPLDEHFDSELLGLLRATTCPCQCSDDAGRISPAQLAVASGDEVTFEVYLDTHFWHWRIRGLEGKKLASAVHVYDTKDKAFDAVNILVNSIRDGRVAVQFPTEKES